MEFLRISFRTRSLVQKSFAILDTNFERVWNVLRGGIGWTDDWSEFGDNLWADRTGCGSSFQSKQEDCGESPHPNQKDIGSCNSGERKHLKPFFNNSLRLSIFLRTCVMFFCGPNSVYHSQLVNIYLNRKKNIDCVINESMSFNVRDLHEPF